jgi:hypothetical protein
MFETERGSMALRQGYVEATLAPSVTNIPDLPMQNGKVRDGTHWGQLDLLIAASAREAATAASFPADAKELWFAYTYEGFADGKDVVLKVYRNGGR